MAGFKLRPYQEKVIEEAREAVRSGHKSLLVFIPTGGGKTAVASQMMHTAFKAGYRSIVLAHRRELVIQTAERFRQYGIEPTILMDGFEFDPSASLVVASQQTWDSRRQWLDGEYRLAIFDEAHIGVNRQRRIMEDIRAVSPDAIFVGLTATPMTNSGPGLGSIYSYLVHGPTLSELTEQGYLVPAEHYVMQPIDFNPVESIKIKGGEYDEENVFEWFTRNAILGDVITNWEDNFYGKRTIVFARSVKQSVYIAKGFGDKGIPFAHLDYRTPEKDRRRIIEGFRNGDIVGITSVDIVSEGFDVPGVEVAILATPIHTVTRYIQRVGRVLRPAPGKEKAYIVDHGGVLNEHGTIYNFQEWALEPERPDRFVPYHALKGLKADWKRKCPTCGHEFKPGPKVCPRCGYDFYVLPPGYEPPIIPATMVEYENAKKYEREGRRKKCRGMNLPFYYSPQSVYDWLRHLAVLREWKLGFADVLFYSATCSCPNELHLIRYHPEQLLKMYGNEPHEVAVKIMKRYWVLKNRGYFKTFKCWD